MKIPSKLACLLACLVVMGVGCPRSNPAGTPEECRHWIGLSDPMLSAMAPATEAGHHAFWAQSQHPTGILTSLPDQPPQAGSQSTHAGSPSMITTTTTNQSKRRSPPRIELPFGSPIKKKKTGRPSRSSAVLPITQLSTDPRLDLIPFHSHIQSDHRQPHLDSALEPPSQGKSRKRKSRPQRALDEPTHPVMGSVQGSELPPQALMMFDVLLFQLVGSADVAAYDHHVQQIQIDGIRQMIQASPSQLLVIPEEKFMEQSISYNFYLQAQNDILNRQEGPNVYQTKKAGTANTAYLNRRFRLRAKVIEFKGHVDFWYNRWFANTGTDFKIDPNLAHYQFLSPQRRVIIHSLYLFYVEMISSIVPRKSQSMTLASELKLAQEAFERLSTAANKRAVSRDDEQSFNNADVKGSVSEEANKVLNQAAEKLKDQRAAHGLFNTFPPLWTYLEFWMDTNRPGIFKHSSEFYINNLPVTTKSFFNDIFFYSYTSLYKECLLYQNQATPFFMSKKKKTIK